MSMKRLRDLDVPEERLITARIVAYESGKKEEKKMGVEKKGERPR